MVILLRKFGHLFLNFSDMDLVVIGEWDTLPLHSLAQALLKSNVCDNEIQVLEKSTVSDFM